MNLHAALEIPDTCLILLSQLPQVSLSANMAWKYAPVLVQGIVKAR